MCGELLIRRGRCHMGWAAKHGEYSRCRTPWVRVRSPRQSNHNQGVLMNLYAILRRSGWASGDELTQAAERSTKVGNEEMSNDVRWIRSYVLDEGAGSVGTVCIYEATSPEAIRRHADLADLPVDEIVPVADTVIVRQDPQPTTA